jgi:GxxExxY protein
MSLVIGALTERVIAAAIVVHRRLGPGLLESAYEAVLEYELRRHGLHVQRQVPVALHYDELRIETAYRIDLLVNECVVLEVKSVERLHPIHEVQLLTYLRLARRPVGLLLNFNELRLTDGLKRKINWSVEAAPPPQAALRGPPA